MTRVLFFDTETTGLTIKDAPPEQQPHILQFAAIIVEYDENWQQVGEEETIDLLFKSPNPIPAEATSINGITDEMVAEKPHFSEYLCDWVDITDRVDLIIGHNVAYDTHMVHLNIERRPDLMPDGWNELDIQSWKDQCKAKRKCTMFGTTKFCGLKKENGGPKWPTLQELHQKLFGIEFEDAHNAMIDARATQKCFLELKKLGEF